MADFFALIYREIPDGCWIKKGLDAVVDVVTIK